MFKATVINNQRSVIIIYAKNNSPQRRRFNPRINWRTHALPKAKVGLTLLKKKLGFRYLMDVIPLDASLVKGSHGHITDSVERSPLLITQQQNVLDKEKIEAKEVFQIILDHLV